MRRMLRCVVRGATALIVLLSCGFACEGDNANGEIGDLFECSENQVQKKEYGRIQCYNDFNRNRIADVDE